jgi:hypothetical protein
LVGGLDFGDVGQVQAHCCFASVCLLAIWPKLLLQPRERSCIHWT